jgi:hypothetical protein
VIVCSAYIDEVIQRPEGTGVVLRPPSGQRLVWITERRPDHDAATALRAGHPRVFTVQMTPAGSDMCCTVLVGSERGARRVHTSLEVGLALCQAGIHGTVRVSGTDVGGSRLVSQRCERASETLGT